MGDRSPADPDPLLDPPSWLPRWFPSVDDERRLRMLRWFIGAVLVLGVGSCMVKGADNPPDPVLVDPGADAVDDGPDAEALAADLGLVRVALQLADGAIRDLCVLLADDQQERARGLMDVTEFGAVDGMLFRFEADSESPFYMFDTPTPLEISWWRDDGSFVSSTRMEPCLGTPASECERHPPAGPYRVALEVPAGTLADLDLSGAVLTVGEACTAD